MTELSIGANTYTIFPENEFYPINSSSNQYDLRRELQRPRLSMIPNADPFASLPRLRAPTSLIIKYGDDSAICFKWY